MLNNKRVQKHPSNLLQQLLRKSYHHAQIDKARVGDRTLLLNKT